MKRTVVFVAVCCVFLADAHARVFSTSELSESDWTTPGYGLELALTSRWSTPQPSQHTQGYGFQIAPSYHLGRQLRLGLELSYHFLQVPVGGLHNALRLWVSWSPISWHHALLGMGWAKERRIYDRDRRDIPSWVRLCREMTLPQIFQRQQIFWHEDSNYRWGPAFDIIGGYGACRSETNQTERRWMWAGQLLLTFAWR